MKLKLIPPEDFREWPSDEVKAEVTKLNLQDGDLLIVRAREDTAAAAQLAWEIGQVQRRSVLYLVGGEEIFKIDADELRKAGFNG